MDNKHTIKITASSVEEYKEIQEKLYSLPDYIKSQIESAAKGIVGIECVFKNTFRTDVKFILPANTTQIQNFDDYIGIYSKDFFFKVPKEMMKYKLSYIIEQDINKIDKAIEYIKNNQCDVHVNQPYLLLGNVAELITILTENEINVETITYKK